MLTTARAVVMILVMVVAVMVMVTVDGFPPHLEFDLNGDNGGDRVTSTE